MTSKRISEDHGTVVSDIGYYYFIGTWQAFQSECETHGTDSSQHYRFVDVNEKDLKSVADVFIGFGYDDKFVLEDLVNFGVHGVSVK